MSRGTSGKRTTLQDIARATGFTVNTVSRALKKMPDISLATRETIQRVADEMGYVRNSMASSLRSGRSGTLGVIIGAMHNPFFAVLVEQIENAARALGYTLLIICSHENAALEEEAVQTAIERQVDGLLICPCQASDVWMGMVRAARLPFVLLCRKFDDHDTDTVLFDEEMGGYLATRHLIAAGHRKLAYLYSDDIVFSLRMRRAGFLRAAREAGIPPENLRLYRHIWQTDVSEQLLRWRQDGVTGIFAFCDMEAWSLINPLQAAGYRVPEDFAFAAFDNIQGHLSFPSPLCSIAGDTTALCGAAVRLLDRRIQGDDAPPRTETFPVRIVCRGSCGVQGKAQ